MNKKNGLTEGKTTQNTHTNSTTFFYDFLSSLDKVKQVGPNRYRALCPSHGSKNQTLSVALSESGKLLIKCWSRGCTYEEVLRSVGTNFWPANSPNPYNYEQRRDYAIKKKRAEYMELLSTERHIVMQLQHKIDSNQPINDIDRQRGLLAVDRILKIDHALKGLGAN
jgi:hypothetical protein